MPEFIELTIPDDHTTVSLLLWQTFKSHVHGHLEQTLALNPELAAAGVHPPAGTRFKVQVPAGYTKNADGSWTGGG